MALSVIVYPGNGSTKQYSIPFSLGYINESDITCRVGSEVDGTGAPLYRTLTFLSPTLVEHSGAAAATGVNVIFTRTVARTNLIVDYSNGDIINEENLNTSQLQALMLVHEVLDGRFEQFQSDVNASGFTITNLREPTASSDAVTKNYADTLIPTGAVNAAAAAASAGAAAASASGASSSASAASGSASAASSSATSAATSATASSTSETASSTARDWSYSWSNAAHNTSINDGIHTGYSAYHWAIEAATAAGGGVTSWIGNTGAISLATVMASIGGNAFPSSIGVSNASADAVMFLNKPTGTYSNSLFGQRAGSSRWGVVLGDSTAESGGNAGSVFQINRYSDAGAFLSTALSLNRSSGAATFGSNVSAPAFLSTGDTDTAAITAVMTKQGDTLIRGSTAAKLNTFLGMDAAIAKKLSGSSRVTLNAALHDIPVPVAAPEELKLAIVGASTNGTSHLALQLKTSAGVVNTAVYLGGANQIGAGSNLHSTFFYMTGTNIGTTSVLHGTVLLTHNGNNVWAYTCMLTHSDGAAFHIATGSVNLPGVITDVRVTTSGGTDVYDAGYARLLAKA
jgi:hypothetical protein